MGLHQQRLKTVLLYDPVTGFFTNLLPRKRIVVGARAGYARKSDGRRVITVDGKKYLASRLAWLYMTGSWPVGEVDHQDVDHTNDAWHNLRDASSTQQKCNTRLRKDSPVGLKGVEKHGSRFRSRISFMGVKYSLGVFATPEEASAARELAAIKLHADFARSN